MDSGAALSYSSSWRIRWSVVSLQSWPLMGGYTRLMGKDEMGTLQRLTSLREGFLEPLIADHRGRVVKLMGDGLLVEFVSIVDTIRCAVKWQTVVEEREAERPEDNRFSFRIGVNLGARSTLPRSASSVSAPCPSNGNVNAVSSGLPPEASQELTITGPKNGPRKTPTETFGPMGREMAAGAVSVRSLGAAIRRKAPVFRHFVRDETGTPKVRGRIWWCRHRLEPCT